MFNFAVILQNPFILFLGKHLIILVNFIIQKLKNFEVYAYFRINHQECY
jgi:hypothetical protein